MTLSDFTKQPRGAYAFDFWVANRAIPTPMGEFAVELQMGIGDNAPPADEMVRQADELVGLLRAHIETIHDKVFEHYQMVAEQGGWLGSCGIPSGLDREGILDHLQVRTLTVSRDEDADEVYRSRVFIVPDWDEEHAIYLAHCDGEWEFVEC
jgi:uncharacterized protein DUF6985